MPRVGITISLESWDELVGWYYAFPLERSLVLGKTRDLVNRGTRRTAGCHYDSLAPRELLTTGKDLSFSSYSVA